MNSNVILIVAGEPNSIFLEILFKSLNKIKHKKYIVLIGCKKNIIKQAKHFSIDIKLNILKENKIINLEKKNNIINLIDVEYKNDKIFQKISSNSFKYIENCFNTAFKILKKNKNYNLINGPISKRYFLKNKYLGVTEYLAEKFNKKNKIAMLIYHRKLSVFLERLICQL